MARIKIELPDTFHFKTQIQVRVTDLNYGGHVGNDHIVSFLHEARVQWLASLGFTELDFSGTALIMTDLAVEYTAELFLHDVLEIEVAVAEVTRVGFECFYRITKRNEEKSVVAAKAKTGMLCFNYSQRKVTSVPPAALAAIQAVS
jgi:acyl-CoA thioester hydrolase